MSEILIFPTWKRHESARIVAARMRAALLRRNKVGADMIYAEAVFRIAKPLSDAGIPEKHIAQAIAAFREAVRAGLPEFQDDAEIRPIDFFG